MTKQKTSIKKWEYLSRIQSVTMPAEQWLNIFGTAGWEFVGVFEKATYFKRPLIEKKGKT